MFNKEVHKEIHEIEYYHKQLSTYFESDREYKATVYKILKKCEFVSKHGNKEEKQRVTSVYSNVKAYLSNN